MLLTTFMYNDPDDYHDSKITLHDCVANKISFNNNVLSFSLPDGFFVCPNHEASLLSNGVRTGGAQVDFAVTPDEHFDVYAEVFKKRKFRKTVVEYWDLEKLIKSINSGKYQIEFIYQYRTHFEQMWLCNLRYKGCYGNECQLHIPYSTATYRWNNLREDCPW